MKSHRFFVVLIASTVLTVFVHQGALAQTHYKDLKYPPLNEIKVPPVERVVLANGMILYLVEDHELPLINLSARIGAGSIDEPADKIGLAGITGDVMRTGGTKSKSGDEIDEELESIAASVETGIGETSGFASMSVLKENVDTGLSILADLLMNPAFPQEKIDLQKVQERSGISRRNDDVNGIAFREFDKLIYGAQSVYARHSEYATIDAVTRDDLVAFHKKYFHPNNVMLGIWGDFKTKEMIKKIDAAFKRWPKGVFKRPQTQPVPYNFDYSVNFVRKEDVNQSTILLGHIGGLMNNPDYFALQVMNDILSGGFSSRLFRHVRSDQGLAYAVFGAYSANFDYPGTFYGGCMTKSETTVKAVRSLLHEIEMIRKEEVTDEELALAKESFLNSFVFNFDTRSEIVNRLMTYEYYGYPKDFLEQTKANIEKVTKAEVLRVAQKYLQPDKVRILVVGKDKDFDEPLTVLGNVSAIDITIPVSEEITPAATAASLSKGRELLNKTIAACGGAAAFKAIKTMQWKRSSTIVTPQGEMAMTVQVIVALPDRARYDISMPMGEMSQILNGEQAWMVSPRGTMPAPAQMKEEMVANLWRDFAYLFANADREGSAAQHLGSEDFEGQKCEVLLITPKGVKSFKLYLNAATMMPVKTNYQAMSMMGPADTDEMFSDFREVLGVKLPFKSVTNQDGKKAQEATATEILINVAVDESQFAVKQ